MGHRKYLTISVDSLLTSIAFKEANGYDFEANVLKGLINMTPYEEKNYKIMLESCKASKIRRENGYK